MECVEQTLKVAECVSERPVRARRWSCAGAASASAFRILRTIVRALPHPPTEGQQRFRLAVMHGRRPRPPA